MFSIIVAVLFVIKPTASPCIVYHSTESFMLKPCTTGLQKSKESVVQQVSLPPFSYFSAGFFRLQTEIFLK